MASTYSTNLGIELIGTGDQSGTWGATTNTNLGTLLEQAIVGYATQAVTDSASATVLSIANGTSSTGRNYVITLTGVLTANRTVEVPAVNKPYTFFNNTTGGFSVTVKVSGQTGVTIANGKKAIVYTNSTDVIEVANAPATEAGTQTLTNKTLTTPVINGFSGDTSAITIGTTQFVKDTSGNIGIGTSSPGYKLDVVSASDNVGRFSVGNKTIDGTGNVQIFTTNAQGTNIGGSLALGGKNGSAGGFDPWAFGVIKGAKENATSGNFAGYLALATASSGGTISERMRIDSSGNVGIGTSSPTAKLDVSTSINLGANYLNVGLDVGGGGGWISGYNTTYNAGVKNVATGSLSAIFYAGDSVRVYTNASAVSGTEAFERMRIDSSGNVGIGTSSPGNKLTVSGGSIQQYRATGDNSLVVQTGDTSNNYTRYYNTSGITDVGQSNGSGFIAVNGAQPFIISVNSSERMRIDSSGNVGIGTSSPKGKLDSTTGDNSKGLVVSGATNLLRVYPYYNFGGNNRGTIIEATNVAETAYATLSLSGSDIQFISGAAVERMRIDSSGNVGIGTTPGTNSNNIQPVTVYSQGPSKLTVKQGTSASPQTGSNSPLIWAQNYIKYDTPSDPFAQNVGGIFADVEIVNDATPGTQINGTWNAIIGNSVNNGVNWGTSTSQNWSTKGSVIGVTGFARANGFPGDSQIVTGLWGYAQGPTLDATTYANLPSGANWSLCGLEVNIQINHPDIGEQSILVGQGSSVGALLSNYRTAGTGVKDWTFGVAYIGSPNDGNYSSTNIDNWNGFYCGILLDKIKAKGIRFGQYFKTGSYGIYFPDSYAGTQEPAAAIYMGNSKINMGQYTGSSFNNQDLWHDGGQLYWKYGGLTFPLMQMASPYTATVTALTGYILVKDDTGAYRKVAVMA
jgi:hypothetical protein